ncbi:MAG: hypothetical protein RL292_39 [Candidatus Parcubacteria bacterium]|jgi:hypothetical protein
MSVQFEEEPVSSSNTTFRLPRKNSFAEKLVLWGVVSSVQQAQILMLALVICAFGFSIFSVSSIFKDPSPSISAPKNNSLINEPNTPPRLSKPVY